jgi:hypothetical protein
MAVQPDNLSPNQRRAVGALAGGASLISAAALVGVSERTLRRWRTQSLFAEELVRAESETFSLARREIRGATLAASRALREIASDAALPAGARVSAARCLIEFALRSWELDELVPRIAELERHVEQRGSAIPT